LNSHSSFGKEAITFIDFFTVNRIDVPVISNNGEKIAFTVKKADIGKNTYLTQIWIYEYNTKQLKQITGDTLSSTNPVFSAGDQYLYFLKGSTNDKQIWRINLNDSKTKKISDIYGGVEKFILSADNINFIVERFVYPECDNEECQKSRAIKKESSKLRARIIDHLLYRHWDRWLEGQRSHLFLFNAENKEIQDITPGDYDTPPISLGSDQDYCFSPDNKEICFVSNHDDTVATSTNNDLFILSLSENTITKISISKGNDINPQYSPDGKYIAYASMERAGFEADRLRLLLYNRKTKETKEVTKNFHLSVSEIIPHKTLVIRHFLNSP
jgi:Tol biopolymer transport system component